MLPYLSNFFLLLIRKDINLVPSFNITYTLILGVTKDFQNIQQNFLNHQILSFLYYF